MSPRRKPGRIPPQPPGIGRWIELRPLQVVGFVAVALIVALAAAGVGVDSAVARDAIWRVFFVYIFVMLVFRVTGKREVGQMSPFELVTLLMIPELFSVALNRNDSSLGLATVSVSMLILLVFLTGLLTFRWAKAERALEGEPTILVRDGKYLEQNMRRERVTPDEVVTEMHLSGIERLEDVRWAIMEVEGKISIIAKDDPTGSRHSAKKDEGQRG
jgi:uncharacterized membrane protein YcaP (DUF421 family)